MLLNISQSYLINIIGHVVFRYRILTHKFLERRCKMLAVDKKTFEEEILEAEGYILVDFWSEGCEPCKALMPHIVELEGTYGDSIKFCKLDTTKARRLAIKQKILGLPVIAIYKDGEKVDERVKDDATKESVEEMIKKYI